MRGCLTACDEVKRLVGQAACNTGRAADAVKLLCVSKFFPAEDIRVLYDHGVRCFGESREQELVAKAESLPKDIEWHFIGQLQRNKIRKVVKTAAFIHSVTTVSAIERIERIAEEENREPQFFIELNLSGEAEKTGALEEDFPALLSAAQKCRHARCIGLMTMAREGADEAELRCCFGHLKELLDCHADQIQPPMRELSMGMSGDFETAIACGATVVRIGSRIFGARHYGKEKRP